MTDPVMEEGHIYVLSFSDCTVKVGRTTDPTADERIMRHKSTALPGGAVLVDQWISEQHGDSNLTERKLIEFCTRNGTILRGKEWFTGVNYSEVVEYAKGLEMAPPRKVCYCGKHVIPAGNVIPRRSDMDGFLRQDLGLVLPPVLEMVFPGDEQFCQAAQMDDVQRILTRHLTAKRDFEFLSQMAARAWEVLQGVESEIKEASGDE